MKRKETQRAAALEVVADYLIEEIDDVATIVVAVAEMLQDNFGIVLSKSKNKARGLVKEVWDEAVCRAEAYRGKSLDYCRAKGWA